LAIVIEAISSIPARVAKGARRLATR